MPALDEDRLVTWQHEQSGSHACVRDQTSHMNAVCALLMDKAAGVANGYGESSRVGCDEHERGLVHRHDVVRGRDDQVSCLQSEELANAFDSRRRVVWRHGRGHIIPVDASTTSVIRSVLTKF